MTTPDPAPRHHGLLDVADGQQIYWEQWGADDGVPALYLHGGPGGGLGASGYRRRFDLEHVQVFGLDQRGCGRSRPHASEPTYDLAQNTTPHLIRDIEALRKSRGIDAWIVNGVSWGSTLALAYAQAHPGRVLGIVLFAVTTTSRREVDWISEHIGAVFPEAWDRFAAHVEDAGIGYRRGEGRLVEAYAQLLDSTDARVRDGASHAWAEWEDTHVSLGTPGGFSRDPRWDDDAYRLAFARLTSHYWAHDGFVEPILDHMDRLAGIPAVLIHGRRDISGPAVTAWELHRRWPGSELIIDDSDGHGGAAMVDHWDAANARLLAQVMKNRVMKSRVMKRSSG